MKKLLLVSAVAAFLVGSGSVAGGSWGIAYTYSSVAAENIVVADDAQFGGENLRWPWHLKAQADVIRKHTLAATDGKTYAEMPRMIPQVDKKGNPVLDENGEPVMVPNEARNLWVTATTLRTALQLGIVAYMASASAVLFGFISVATGFVFLGLRRRFA